ncbi:MAG: ribonuclease III [Pseudomonadales bacterium]
MTNSSSNSIASLESLQARIGYQFQNSSLLEQALTHRSAVREAAAGKLAHNERLEFLGDAILGQIVAAHLYRSLPSAKESEMTLKRATLVRRETLAELARALKLSAVLRLGAGEKRSGIADNDSILSDALEALVGAIYLDGGFAGAQEFVDKVMGWRFRALDEIATKDAKTRLQELMQGQGLPLPSYQIVRTEGALHEQTFTVECRLATLERNSLGVGHSRREAEKAAAAQLLTELGAHD